MANIVAFAYGGTNLNLPSEAIDVIWLVRSHPVEFNGYSDQHLCAYLLKKLPSLQGSLSPAQIEQIYKHLGTTNDRVLRYETISAISSENARQRRRSMTAYMQA